MFFSSSSWPWTLPRLIYYSLSLSVANANTLTQSFAPQVTGEHPGVPLLLCCVFHSFVALHLPPPPPPPDGFTDPVTKRGPATFQESHPKHLPEVRVPEAEGDVWNMEAFWSPFGLGGVSRGAAGCCGSCTALDTCLALRCLFCLPLKEGKNIGGGKVKKIVWKKIWHQPAEYHVKNKHQKMNKYNYHVYVKQALEHLQQL